MSFKSIKNVILTLFIPIVVCILWQICSENGYINKSILPSPEKVGQSFIKLLQNGSLFKHIVSSLVRVLKGYLIGTLAGISIGIIAALSKNVEKLLQIPIGVLRPVPAIALIPFFILWMGIGEESKVAVIVFGSFWPVLLNTIQGIKSTDAKLLEVGKILEKNKFTMLTQIIFPSALPSILTGLRLGISSAWTCVVAAEMIAASSGIGFLISYSREMSQPASLLIGVATIGLFGLVIDIIFTKLNIHLIFWQKQEVKSKNKQFGKENTRNLKGQKDE